MIQMHYDHVVGFGDGFHGYASDADAKIRGDLAHTLRGSALSIGAGRVARAAQVYEAACVSGLRGGALSATGVILNATPVLGAGNIVLSGLNHAPVLSGAVDFTALDEADRKKIVRGR